MFKTIEKTMFLFVLAYQNHMLEQRDTCLLQRFWTLKKIAVKLYAGGLNRKTLDAFEYDVEAFTSRARLNIMTVPQ